MTDYLYDGTYEGFLTCLYHHFATEPATNITEASSYQITFSIKSETILTKQKKADYMADLLDHHLGSLRTTDVYFAFLSEVPGWEKVVLSFVDLCFRQGARYADAHSHEQVFPFDQLVRKVKMEVHRYQGFVRFQAWGSGLYAKIHPEFFILPALEHHFVDRYRNEKIIIHDAKRHVALLAQNGKSLLIPYSEEQFPQSPPEDPFITLWKQYVKTIAIESRINRKLQRQFVPLKYRKDLVEME